jgi:hypothetical protein
MKPINMWIFIGEFTVVTRFKLTTSRVPVVRSTKDSAKSVGTADRHMIHADK